MGWDKRQEFGSGIVDDLGKSSLWTDENRNQNRMSWNGNEEGGGRDKWYEHFLHSRSPTMWWEFRVKGFLFPVLLVEFVLYSDEKNPTIESANDMERGWVIEWSIWMRRRMWACVEKGRGKERWMQYRCRLGCSFGNRVVAALQWCQILFSLLSYPTLILVCWQSVTSCISIYPETTGPVLCK